MITAFHIFLALSLLTSSTTEPAEPSSQTSHTYAAKHIQFRAQPQDAILREGYPHNINCLATTYIPHAIISISWMYNGTLIQNYTGTPFKLLKNHTLYFARFPRGSNGYYRCSVLLFTITENKTPNEIESALSRKAVVQTMYFEKHFKVCPQQEVSVNISDNVNLRCISPKSLPPAVVYWLKDGFNVSGYQNFIVNDRVSSLFQIEKFTYKDVGQYRCCVYNSMDGRALCCGKSSVNIRITQNQPYIAIAPQPTAAIQFHSTRMDCLILGNPLPKITWLKNGKSVTSTPGRKILANNSLVISRVDKSDHAYYTCSGSNELGLVISPPIELVCAFIEFDFLVNPESQTVLRGDTLFLHCQAPPSVPRNVEISWYKNFVDLVYDDRIKKLSNGSLKISSAQLLDTGQYMCWAYNELVGVTRSSKVANITVLVSPILNIDISLSAVIEYPLTIDCNSSGVPPPNTTLWKRNPVTSQVEIISHNGKFAARSAAVSHGGTYICTAENVAGKVMRNVQVNILLPPQIVEAPSNVTLIVGEPLMLPCQVTGHLPRLRYWKVTNRRNLTAYITKNTSDITIGDSKLLIYKTVKEHEGLYECVMENEVGAVHLSAFVRVLVPPTVLNITTNSTAHISSSLTLICTVHADPAVEIYWNTKNVTISRNSTKHTLLSSKKVTSGGVISSLQLTMKDLTLSDAGIYFCNCHNRLGYGSVATSIDVVSAPSIQRFSVEGRMHEHDSLMINCTAMGSPTPNVSVYHNETALRSHSHWTRQFVTSQTVKMYNISMTASGLYQCFANNSVGRDVVNRSVQVKSRPHAPLLHNPRTLSSTSIFIAWELKFDGYSPILSTLLEIISSSKSTLHRIKPTITEYYASGLTPFTKYSFRVRVLNEVGVGVSMSVHALTLAAAPSPPLNLTFRNLTRNSVHLSWGKPLHTNGIIKLFNISVQSRVNFSVVDEVETEQPEYRHILTGLKPYTWYQCVVRAATVDANSTNWGNLSMPIRFRTSEWFPGVVRDLSARFLNITAVNVSWTEPKETNGVIIRYNVNTTYAERTIYNMTTKDQHILLAHLMPYSEYTAYVSAETAVGLGKSNNIQWSSWPQPTEAPPNSTTPANNIGPDRWLSRDYMLVIIGISAFASISLFAAITIGIARCLCGGRKNKSSDVFVVQTNNSYNHRDNVPMPMKVMNRIDISTVDFNEDFIFSDQDTSGENVHELPSAHIIRNTRTPSVTGYRSVEPYQGQNMPMSPLVKLKGPSNIEPNPAPSNRRSTPKKRNRKSTPKKTTAGQESGQIVFDESVEDMRVSSDVASGSGGAVNPVYVDSRSRSGSASDESLEELIEAFLTQKKEGEKAKKRGKK